LTAVSTLAKLVRPVSLMLALLGLAQSPRSTGIQSEHSEYDGRFRISAPKGVEEAYLPTLFPSSHAPNLLELRNGDLLCFWFSGTEEGASNVAIVMSRLPKGSSVWGKPVEIDHQQGQSFQNPVAFQTSDGRIWLMHTSQSAGQGQGDAQVFYLTSDCLGRSWTKPKPLFTKAGSFIRHPPLLLQDKWILPLYYTPSGSITNGAETHYSVAMITSDAGRSWKQCNIPKSHGLVQPDIVRLASGRFAAFFRSRYADFIYKSNSKDGCAWSIPVRTTVPNNNSSVQVTVLRNRSLVLVFNNANVDAETREPRTGPRTPLSIALSQDEGNTWHWVRDIEGGTAERHPSADDEQEYSYPSVLQDQTGKINVAYTFLRKTIKVVRFQEDWIKQGKTEGKFLGDSRVAR
jgi:predicted neuraminidase